MVRVNLISPRKLADQHLIAEYNEILMLVAYIRKHSSVVGLPARYCLGVGHMRFFKDKLVYLQKRHELLSLEMKRRGFQVNKVLDVSGFGKENLGDWKPKKEDVEVIKGRLIEKLRLKPEFYRYCGEKKDVGFFVGLIS